MTAQIIRAALSKALPFLVGPAIDLAKRGAGHVGQILTQKAKKSIAALPPGQRGKRLAQIMNSRAASVLRQIDSMPYKPGTEKISRDAQFRSNPTNRRQVAPTGQGYYDAFVQTPDSAVTLMSVGYATPIKGLARYTTPMLSGFATVAGSGAPDGSTVNLPPVGSTNGGSVAYNPSTMAVDNGMMLIFSHTGVDATVARMYHKGFDALGNATIQTVDINCKQFEGMAIDTEVMPVRGSLRIRNVTEALRVGGTVRVLRFPGGLTEPSNITEMDTLEELVRSSVHTTTYSAHELTSMHQKNTYVCDQSRACFFYSVAQPPYTGVVDPLGVDQVAGISPASTANHFETRLKLPAFTPLIVLFEPFASDGLTPHNNTYEITIAVQRLARFAPGSLLHGLATDTKTLPPTAINGFRDREEAIGSLLQKVQPLVGTITGAALDAVSAKAQSALAQRLSAGHARKIGGLIG